MIKYKNLSITEIPITDIEKVAIVNLNGLTMNEWYNKQSVKPKYMLNASLWDSKGAIGTLQLRADIDFLSVMVEVGL